MFRDKITLNLQSGAGGAGKVSFGRSRKPDGGNGGPGGDVYLVGSSHRYDLRGYESERLYEAGRGGQGGVQNSTGATGADLEIEVPLATVLYDDKTGELLGEVTEPGERLQILKGGLGGLGNQFFKPRGIEYLNRSTPGREGEEIRARLELELVSDVLLIGLPNAGKSSLLKELTNAEAKVGAYAFTTINPQLGRLHSTELTLLDLPGLIEGTYAGRGLGPEFLRHTRRTRAIAHCLSLAEPAPVANYHQIRTELENLDPELADLPEFIILTKSDELAGASSDIESKIAKELGKPAITASIIDDAALEKLVKFIPDYLAQLY